MLETESKNESQFNLTLKNVYIYFIFIKKTVIFFSDSKCHDLGFLTKILIFLGFSDKTHCQDIDKKFKKSKILARNKKNPRSWEDIQDYPKFSKILARKLRRQALG